MSSFSNARGFTINDGSFTNVAGDQYNFHVRGSGPEDLDFPGKGLGMLFKTAVVSAAHDAEQRFPPPNCHPGTRIRILEILRNWVNDNSTEIAPVYWLYGAAGVGKSAVAQTFSEEFASSRLAASFFFSRSDPTRNHLQHFFTTISLQLATSHFLGPLLRESIDLTIRHNPSIIHANLERQFQELIVKPCDYLTAEQWRELPQLIVIDGLDECIDIASQERLLSIIRKAKSHSMLPFKFLICSRPEPRIRNAFNHLDFRTIVARSDLGEAFESRMDLTKYLREEFNRIRRDHGSTMAHEPQDWPGEGIIQQLVQRACGQFIYATTVLKYIGEYHGLPTKQLETILNIIVPEDFDSPYPDLDLLYLQILSTCKQKELLLDVLAHLLDPDGVGIFMPKSYNRTSSHFIEGLFFLVRGEVGMLFFRMHSVLDIPDDISGSIRVRHASFVDFLRDKKRSRSYYVNTLQEAQRERITFYLLKRVSFSIKNDRNLLSMNSEFDIYARHKWCYYLQDCTSLSSRLLGALKDFDITGYLNVAAWLRNTSLETCISSLRKSLDDLSRVADWAKDTRSYQKSEHRQALDRLAKQYSLFEQGFRVRIEPTLKRGDRENLMTTIEVFKHTLCLPLSATPAVISALLKSQASSDQVRHILSSDWSCPPILPLDPTDSMSELHFDTVSIDFAEWNKHIGLQCLRILRNPSQSAEEGISFAKLEWMNYLLAKPARSYSEDDEIFQALMESLSAIRTSEDVRKVIEWVEHSGYSSQIKALHEWLQELENHRPKGRWTYRLFRRLKLR
ncbi:hypothetical protein GYMLUDRAFT_42422 [Collybiopsis luxurians FD-317 M1]|uniref:Nephrocystin 3-like N-terminal domain-containing protein n=1 Tax=Collybiopsis luxurians FD-317 M1 TaxID=944289 RepID=A0A0D0CZL4_9AGAR|nr:hypothetical protein GYMLUDRAFT_42422 [Collybiopsis luxurians FD-317 M1]